MDYRRELERAAVEPAFAEAEARASQAVVDTAIIASPEPSSRGAALVGQASDLARIAIADMERLRSTVATLAV